MLHIDRLISFFPVSKIALFSFFLVITLIPLSAYPAENSNQIDWLPMMMSLVGGLAMFLFGMEIMIKSVLVVAGNEMKVLLAKLTTNRVMGALTGAVVTSVIQSSSVTSVLTVGFVSAGLITVSQAAGVIMGANLGTTITAQVIAFKVTNFALLMIAAGFLIQFLSKRSKYIAFGNLILGLGLIFFGMNVMGEGMSPLRDYSPFLDLMTQLQNPILGILVGLVFTALIQSSSATLGIIIVMASSGFLTLPAGIALAMGANIGTTITALLSTIGKSRDAIRTGLIHFQFNFFGVLIFLPFIPHLTDLAVYLSSHEAITEPRTMATLAANTPREIANANTIFNLINILIFLPFAHVMVWVSEKLVPKSEEEKSGNEFKPEFLDESFLSSPGLAMNNVEFELARYQQKYALFYKRVASIVENPHMDKLAREDLNLARFREYNNLILGYLGKTGLFEMTPAEQTRFMELMNLLNTLDFMSESIETNILKVSHKLTENDVLPTLGAPEILKQLSNEVGKSINNSIDSILQNDNDSALAVISIKETIDSLIQEATKIQVKRFKTNNKELLFFRDQMQLLDGFKQLHTLSKRLARVQLDHSKQLSDMQQPEQISKID